MNLSDGSNPRSTLKKNQRFTSCKGLAFHKDTIFDKIIGLNYKKIEFYQIKCSENQRFDKFIEM